MHAWIASFYTANTAAPNSCPAICLLPKVNPIPNTIPGPNLNPNPTPKVLCLLPKVNPTHVRIGALTMSSATQP
jgi:hypothetical protein